MPVARTLNKHFFKTWSPEMAYVLGFFAADGSMISGERKNYYIEFTSTDRILLEHVQHATGSNHTLSVRSARSNKWKLQYRLQIGSKNWFEDLTSLGFTERKSRTLCFPDVPQDFLSHFIRGYFDGDGCVYFKEHVFAGRTYPRFNLLTLFTSGSRTFLISLWEVLKRHGVQGGSLRTKKRGFDLAFSHRDSLALYRLLYHTIPTSNLFLPRKREKLERAIQVLGLDKTMRS